MSATKEEPSSRLEFVPEQRPRKSCKKYSVEKTHQSQESELEVMSRMLPHSSEIQRNKRKRGPGSGRIPAVGTLPTFNLLYPLRLLQYQQPMNSKIPRITVKMPIPTALAQQIDKSILVQKPVPYCDEMFSSSLGLCQPRAAPASP